MIPMPKNCEYYEPEEIHFVPEDEIFWEKYSEPRNCQNFLRNMLCDDSIIITHCEVCNPLEDIAICRGKSGILCRDTKGMLFYIEAHQDRRHSSINRAMLLGRALRKQAVEANPSALPPYINIVFYTEEDEFGKGQMLVTLKEKRKSNPAYESGYTMHYVWGGFLKATLKGMIVGWE